MFFTNSVYVGIDPTSGRKAFTFAAIDKELNLLTLSDGETEEVCAYLAAQEAATVAVNAPMGVNRGLVREQMKREMLTPHQIRGAELRLAEYELRERGIGVSGTPANVALCAGWIQLGFEMYRKLEQIGFKKYPDKKAPRMLMETHPQACFCVLVGSPPLSKSSLEGRIQRQLLLYDHGLQIRDPMDFFEEITRFKLVNGKWPMDILYMPEQLDALIAAYTAWSTVHKPDHIVGIGDPEEGTIILPVKALKEKY